MFPLVPYESSNSIANMSHRHLEQSQEVAEPRLECITKCFEKYRSTQTTVQDKGLSEHDILER